MVAAHAQTEPDYDSRLLTERPDPPGTITEIELSLFLLDIDYIDDARQRFNADLFMVTRWHDPRLALDDQANEQERTFGLDTIWTPRGLIVNDRDLIRKLPQIATVDQSGQVIYRQRLSGELSANFDFREFPFDTQPLTIDVVSYAHVPDELSFSTSSELSEGVTDISVDGWRLTVQGSQFNEAIVASTGVVFPRLVYTIEAKRDSNYYLLTLFLPMTLIVFMAWSVFWLQPELTPSRIAISTASIFSLIAFGFSMRLSLPSVSYLTRADIFVIGCTLMVFIALAVAVMGSRWANSERVNRALRLNAIARWIYPVLFVIVVLMTVSP